MIKSLYYILKNTFLINTFKLETIRMMSQFGNLPILAS